MDLEDGMAKFAAWKWELIYTCILSTGKLGGSNDGLLGPDVTRVLISMRTRGTKTRVLGWMALCKAIDACVIYPHGQWGLRRRSV